MVHEEGDLRASCPLEHQLLTHSRSGNKKSVSDNVLEVDISASRLPFRAPALNSQAVGQQKPRSMVCVKSKL